MERVVYRLKPAGRKIGELRNMLRISYIEEVRFWAMKKTTKRSGSPYTKWETVPKAEKHQLESKNRLDIWTGGLKQIVS